MALPLVEGAAAAQGAARLPSRQDVAAAHSTAMAHLCQQLIDQCEVLPASPTPDAVEALACSGRGTRATCRFRFAGERCVARFVLQRIDGVRRWTVERRPARFYGRPQVDCRR